MALCIFCKNDSLNYYEIKTKRGNTLYVCKSCAEKNKNTRKENQSSNDLQKK